MSDSYSLSELADKGIQALRVQYEQEIYDLSIRIDNIIETICMEYATLALLNKSENADVLHEMRRDQEFRLNELQGDLQIAQGDIMLREQAIERLEKLRPNDFSGISRYLGPPQQTE